jgi:hypothetical protein
VTALSFLPFGVNGPETFRVFASRTLRNDQGYDFAYSGNQSLRGTVARLRSRTDEMSPSNADENRQPGEPLTMLISLALIAVAIFAASRSRNEFEGAAPFFCCMVMLSPLSWKAHYVILLLPAAYLASSLNKGSGKSRYIAPTAIGVSFILFNLTSPHVIGLAAAEWADSHSLVLAGALLIFIACILNVCARTMALSRRPSDPSG